MRPEVCHPYSVVRTADVPATSHMPLGAAAAAAAVGCRSALPRTMPPFVVEHSGGINKEGILFFGRPRPSACCPMAGFLNPTNSLIMRSAARPSARAGRAWPPLRAQHARPIHCTCQHHSSWLAQCSGTYTLEVPIYASSFSRQVCAAGSRSRCPPQPATDARPTTGFL